LQIGRGADGDHEESLSEPAFRFKRGDLGPIDLPAGTQAKEKCKTGHKIHPSHFSAGLTFVDTEHTFFP